MVLFYHSIDGFQKTNDWSVTLSIIALVHCTIQVFLFNAIIVILLFFSIVFVHDGLGNKVVGVVFAYLWRESEGSVDHELCSAKWFDKCSWKWFRVHGCFVILISILI